MGSDGGKGKKKTKGSGNGKAKVSAGVSRNARGNSAGGKRRKRGGCLRCVGWTAALLVAVAAIAVALVLRTSPDDGVDGRIKYFLHPIAKIIYVASGLGYPERQFQRWILDICVPLMPASDVPDENGVTSLDVDVDPHDYPEHTHPELAQYGIKMPAPAKVPVRIYLPKEARERKDKRFPLLLWIHGGGFVVGSAKDRAVDPVTRRWASEGKWIVVSVDYRKAPEDPFPAAVEDCFAALLWCMNGGNGHPALQNADTARLIVGGDSAGGNLAAAMTLLARDRPGTKSIVHQILVYPTYFHEPKTESARLFADGYMLTAPMKTWFNRQYFTNPSITQHFYLSPTRLNTSALVGLPSAQTILAELDPLRDEGKLYAEKLKEAGVESEVRIYPRQVHGFFTFDFLDEAHQALRESVATYYRLYGK